MVEKVKEHVQMPAVFMAYYLDATESHKNPINYLDFNEQLAGFSKTIDLSNVCKNHDIAELKKIAHHCLQQTSDAQESSISKDALFSVLAQELLASPLMNNLRTWAWTNLELQLKTNAKSSEQLKTLVLEWSQHDAHFHKLNPILLLKAWSFFKQGQLLFNLDCEVLSSQIETEVLNTFQLSATHDWLNAFIAQFKKIYILPKLTCELLALAYDLMVPSVMPLVRCQFRQILRQEKIGNKPLLLIYPHGKSGVMMLVMNKYGDMIDESMIYPFAPDYDEEQALVHFSKLMMKYPNEHVVWMLKSETRKPIQSLLDKFKQRYPDLSWKLHGLPNLLSHLLVKTKTPQTEDVLKIGHLAQNPSEILATLNSIDLIDPILKNLPHEQIKAEWTTLFQEHLLFSGLDIQKASPTLLKASELFSTEDIKKIVETRETNPFNSKSSVQKLIEKTDQEFNPISVFIRINNSNDPFENSFFVAHDKAYIENICQQLTLHDMSELLNYPAFKLKAFEATPSSSFNRLKKLLHVYQQFNKHAEIYDKKIYANLEEIPRHKPFLGVVTKIMPYGAFIDLGYGLEGLLHHSALIQGLSPDPKLILTEGDTIKVEWLNYDAQQKRLSFKYHADYFIPQHEFSKKPPIGAKKEEREKKVQKTNANKPQKTNILNNTPTAMALAFAKLKEPSNNNT